MHQRVVGHEITGTVACSLVILNLARHLVLNKGIRVCWRRTNFVGNAYPMKVLVNGVLDTSAACGD
jgi:hypothetical protein